MNTRTTDSSFVPSRRPLLVCLIASLLLMTGLPLMAGYEPQQRDPASAAGQGERARDRGAGDRTSPALPAPSEEEIELAELLREGATMEEIAALREPIAGTPDEALRALMGGNARFFGGTARRPELDASERRAQVLSQHPFAVILGCSDSRVPTEIVYDQGLGTLFVIRVAGNVVEPATAGSVEYAITHLKSHLVVVMGHEGCGAVAAAMLPQEKREAESENVRALLDLVRPAVAGIPELRDRKARMREAVTANVRLQVHQLRQNPTVAEAIEQGRINVVGAYYEISSGAVDFLIEDEELALSDEERRRVTASGAGNQN